MLRDVVEVRALGGHRLFLRFDDGKSGEIDLGRTLTFTGVFAPLRNPKAFARVFVHPEFHTVSWPNDVDLDTDVLYSEITGAPLPGGGTLPVDSKRGRRPPAARRSGAKPPRRRVRPATAKSRKVLARGARAS